MTSYVTWQVGPVEGVSGNRVPLSSKIVCEARRLSSHWLRRSAAPALFGSRAAIESLGTPAETKQKSVRDLNWALFFHGAEALYSTGVGFRMAVA